MAWWSRKQGLQNEGKRSVPKGLWVKCQHCGESLFERELGDNQQVCRFCGFHIRLSTKERMALVIDEGSFQEHDQNLLPNDPLQFKIDQKTYKQSVENATQKAHGAKEAYIAGSCKISGIDVEIGFLYLNLWVARWGLLLAKK